MAGVGYGGGGGGGWDDGAMVRQAEERTRSTFQSVETVVGAFSSVSTLLLATYIFVCQSINVQVRCVHLQHTWVCMDTSIWEGGGHL